MHLDPINRKWLLVFLATLIPSVVGAIMPITLMESAKSGRRPHHQAKLWNEVLAKHQIAYAVYFLAVAWSANFPEDVKVWIQHFFQVGVSLAFSSYFLSIHSFSKMEARIKAFHHPCRGGCTYTFTSRDFLRLCGKKLIATAVLISMAFYTALRAI